MRRTLHIIYLTMLLALLGSCVDEIRMPGDVEEGVSDMMVSVSFADFNPAALDSRSAGDAIKTIDKLWVVVFDTQGVLHDKLLYTKSDLTINSRPDGEPSSETKTGHASFRLHLPNGKYRIYAVANTELSDEDVASEEALRGKKLTWDSDDLSANCEMMGYFTNSEKGGSDATEGFEAPEVTVNGKLPLHAWLRRAASKLTVAFDTSNLRENVYIWIKSVSVRDIPYQNYLGRDNRPGEEGREISDSLIHLGEHIYLNGAAADDGKEAHTKWRELSRGLDTWGLRSEKEKAPEGLSHLERIAYEHNEKAPAFYFYENRQLPGIEGQESDKRQDVTGNNKEVSFPMGGDTTNVAWKDQRPYGSYVEVKGYYNCLDSIRPGQGEIIYRFMLGKDTKTNYDAERNHHYQLTLKFNGYANDIDWHIDYREEFKPGLFTPDTTYVSYLYNQRASTVARAIPREGYKLKKLTAYILDNEWRPHPDGDSPLYNELAWNNQVAQTGLYKGGKAEAQKHIHEDVASNCEFGFLSLRHVAEVDIDCGGLNAQRDGTLVNNIRDLYYRNEAGNTSKPKGKREYSVPASETPKGGVDYTDNLPGEDDGSYNVTLSEKMIGERMERTYIYTVPLYTRAKSIDAWANFSGANPFYRHNRYARVLFEAEYVNENDETDTYKDTSVTHVLQSRRIDNPRAIYRSKDNSNSFHVNLKYATLGADNLPNGYESLTSRGPWTATIERDEFGIINISAGKQKAEKPGESISGSTRTEIDFMINFNELTGLTADFAGGAIVTVRYHNNSCVHKIIVRRGYGPTMFPGTQLKWSTYNVYGNGKHVESPLSVGSLFRRHTDVSYPIKESNNTRDNFKLGQNPGTNSEFYIEGQSNTKWDNIPFMKKSSIANTVAFGTFTLNDVDYRVPTTEEVETQLLPTGNNDINFAFGIIYGDGANATLADNNARLFSDPDNEGGESACGVRGVVAYSLSTGRNVPFPFGATGHARRKNTRWGLNAKRGFTLTRVRGMMRYGSIDVRLGGADGALQSGINEYRPMAYTLPDQFGAGYWTSTGKAFSNGEATLHHIALDFNYGNYNTGQLSEDDLYTSGDNCDALPIKPVRAN